MTPVRFAGIRAVLSSPYGAGLLSRNAGLAAVCDLSANVDGHLQALGPLAAFLPETLPAEPDQLLSQIALAHERALPTALADLSVAMREELARVEPGEAGLERLDALSTRLAPYALYGAPARRRVTSLSDAAHEARVRGDAEEIARRLLGDLRRDAALVVADQGGVLSAAARALSRLKPARDRTKAFNGDRLNPAAFVAPDLAALERPREPDRRVAYPVLGRIPGAHGGHLYVVELPLEYGRGEQAENAPPRGDPRWFIDTFGEQAASFFGFRMIRDMSRIDPRTGEPFLLAAIPDHVELPAAVAAYNQRAPRPIRKQFYPVSGVVGDLDHVEGFMSDGVPRFPLAIGWLEGANGKPGRLSPAVAEAVHDATFHAAVILESDEFLDRTRGSLRARKAFLEYVAAAEDADAAVDNAFLAAQSPFKGRGVQLLARYIDLFSGLVLAWFPQSAMPAGRIVKYASADTDARTVVERSVLGSRRAGDRYPSIAEELRDMISFGSAVEPAAFQRRSERIAQFLRERGAQFGPGLAGMNDAALQRERAALRDDIRRVIAGWFSPPRTPP